MTQWTTELQLTHSFTSLDLNNYQVHSFHLSQFDLIWSAGILNLGANILFSVNRLQLQAVVYQIAFSIIQDY